MAKSGEWIGNHFNDFVLNEPRDGMWGNLTIGLFISKLEINVYRGTAISVLLSPKYLSIFLSTETGKQDDNKIKPNESDIRH